MVQKKVGPYLRYVFIKVCMYLLGAKLSFQSLFHYIIARELLMADNSSLDLVVVLVTVGKPMI